MNRRNHEHPHVPGTKKIMGERKQSRRSFLRTIGVGAVCLQASVALAKKLSGAIRPDVIFIITDDQKRTEFNATPEGKGRNLSPNLDSMVVGGKMSTHQCDAENAAKIINTHTL